MRAVRLNPPVLHRVYLLNFQATYLLLGITRQNLLSEGSDLRVDDED